MNDIASTIHHVERLYESITGHPVPPVSEGEQFDPIPPERDPQQYVDEQLERLSRLLGLGFDTGAVRPVWVPTVAMWENAERYVFLVDLPGVARADVIVTVDQQRVEVQGIRPQPANEGAPLYPRWSERAEGAFQRTLPLPPGASMDDVQAELREGVLILQLGRRGRGSPPQERKIDVR